MFLIQSTNAHGIHSPFVFDLYNNVIKDDRYFYVFGELEALRKSLKKNTNVIRFEDHGAGSNDGDRTIASIAKNALSYPYQCRLMFRLVEYLKLNKILELGTSLGLSTLYLSSARANSHVFTLEGDTGSYSMATHLFHQLEKKNITAKLGQFSTTLNPTLETMEKVDLAFLDGHHDGRSTVAYFNNIKAFCHKSSVVIVDDIYWSKEMQNAWVSIQNNEDVTLTLDLFFCGIVFFRAEQKEKEHFKIRPDKILFHR